MEEKFYTIEQIAEILDMHHKTIRKFITEGKLRANKVGRQWRISGHDLSIFVEDNNVNIKRECKTENSNIEFSTNNISSDNRISKMNIATVIDINDVDVEEYRRISNTLLAAINSKQAKMSNSTINIKFYQEVRNLKVMLWGNLEFTKEMLDFTSTLTEDNQYK